MPPPVSYIDIDTIPFSRLVTTTEFNVANEIWFRLVAPAAVAAGSWSSKPSGVSMREHIYASDGTTKLVQLSPSSGVWWELAAGTYYIKFDRFPVSAIAADFTFEFDTKPINPDTTSVPSGTVLITDDNSSQLAGAVFGPDGTLVGFNDLLPTGEMGDALPSGHVLLHDRFGRYASNSVILFGPDLAHIATLTPSPGFAGQWPFIVNDGTDFYVVDNNAGNVFKVTSAGVLTGPIATIPDIASFGATSVGISRDADVIYYAKFNSAIIRQYRISTSTASDFYTISGMSAGEDIALTFNVNPGEIIVLPDDSLVTWWVSASSATTLVHVSAAGALLNTIATGPTYFVNHLHYASAATSTHVKAWMFSGSGGSTTTVGDLNLATGVFDTSFTAETFTAGQTLVSLSHTKFGPSSSCPMVSMSYGLTDEESEGPGAGSPQVNNSVPCCGCDCAPGGGTPAGHPGEILPPPNTAPLPEWTIRCGGGGVYPAGTPVTHSEDWRV